MEDGKLTDSTKLDEEADELEDDEDELDNEEDDYHIEDDEEEMKAFTEVFNAHFTPERWRALSEERDRRAAESKAGGPEGTTQSG